MKTFISYININSSKLSVEFLEVEIRKATPDDAESISYIWEVVCAERIYTAVSTPFTAKQESEYISSLSEREILDLD